MHAAHHDVLISALHVRLVEQQVQQRLLLLLLVAVVVVVVVAAAVAVVVVAALRMRGAAPAARLEQHRHQIKGQEIEWEIRRQNDLVGPTGW